MMRECTQPKRPRSAAWFKEKLMLAEAQEAEVPYSESYPNDMINQDVQEMTYSKQTHIDDYPDNEINSDSNIITYSQYLQESQDAASLDKEIKTYKMVNELLTAELERYKERVTIFEQRQNVDLNKCEKLIDSQMDDLIRNRNAKLVAFQQEIDTLKETLSTHLNKIKEDFGKRFVTQKELSVEQALWLKHSNYNPDTSIMSHTPVRIEAPSELPKSQEKDTIIRKLKDRIKSLSGKDSVENIKKDNDEIETINIELKHSVAKLLSENENLRKEREHLKSIYKDQFDSIRKTRVQSNELCASLIAQMNEKSVANSDLNAQLQEMVFAIATLKNKLRKLKGKIFVDTAVFKT
ncbi:hypothetical protein Tco_0875601 [Tanacetum coccineum]|uniref:Uncharacterized protein n=1 Tax=Tanacetum coccineum TaxID=301880 RepID=A0ABQ5BQ40_9ASTR